MQREILRNCSGFKGLSVSAAVVRAGDKEHGTGLSWPLGEEGPQPKLAIFQRMG